MSENNLRSSSLSIVPLLSCNGKNVLSKERLKIDLGKYLDIKETSLI